MSLRDCVRAVTCVVPLEGDWAGDGKLEMLGCEFDAEGEQSHSSSQDASPELNSLSSLPLPLSNSQSLSLSDASISMAEVGNLGRDVDEGSDECYLAGWL